MRLNMFFGRMQRGVELSSGDVGLYRHAARLNYHQTRSCGRSLITAIGERLPRAVMTIIRECQSLHRHACVIFSACLRRAAKKSSQISSPAKQARERAKGIKILFEILGRWENFLRKF